MRLNYGLQLFEDSTMQVLIADLTYLATVQQCTTDEHGYGELRVFVPMGRLLARMFYDGVMTYHVHYGTPYLTVFEGRVSDKTLQPGGVEFIAEGYWAALFDGPYTALWSTNERSIRQFKTMLAADRSNILAERYQHDKNGRLFGSLRKNEVYGNTIDRMAWSIATPNEGYKNLAYFSFDYEHRLPTNWRMQVYASERDYASPASVWSATGTGSATPVTGSASATSTGTGKQVLEAHIYNNTGTTYAVTVNSGYWYAKYHNIRVWTHASSAGVDAQDVVAELVAYARLTNPGMLAADTSNIEAMGVDLADIEWQDTQPGDVIKDLLMRGDTTPARWEAAVWEGQLLYFRPRGSGARNYVTEVVDVELSASLGTVFNSIYATYTTDLAPGQLQRSAAAEDTASQERYGVTRGMALHTDGNADTIEAMRDVALAENSAAVPRARLVCSHLYTEEGAPVPVAALRAGDILTLRNLSAYGLSELEDYESFVVSRTTYKPADDTILPEPEFGLGLVQVMLQGGYTAGPKPALSLAQLPTSLSGSLRGQQLHYPGFPSQ